ncbi:MULTISPECIES: hypothetical protein [unclassified Streptomyces]|uniref:hypothetical protein n=1 Tax=unclassified Streptomyces TaxID=2593676 RepID=UPI00039C28C0|nr:MULTISPECIES: hypothetical protein [unclassified Streptomyces]MYT28081.1 hypothetical protein [Streptomyces sp. SID8354]
MPTSLPGFTVVAGLPTVSGRGGRVRGGPLSPGRRRRPGHVTPGPRPARPVPGEAQINL